MQVLRVFCIVSDKRFWDLAAKPCTLQGLIKLSDLRFAMFKVIFFVGLFVAFMLYRAFLIHRAYKLGTPKKVVNDDDFIEDDDIYSPSSTWHPLNMYRDD